MSAILTLAALLAGAVAQQPSSQEQAKTSVVMVTTLPPVNRNRLGTRTTAENQTVDLKPSPIRDRKDLATGILFDAGDKDRLYVITVAHIITQNDEIWVHALSGNQEIRSVQCPVVHYDRVRDLAILTLARERDLEARAIRPDQLQGDMQWISHFSKQDEEKRSIVAIGHIQGEGARGGGLSWSPLGGKLVAVVSVDRAARTILKPEDYDALDSDTKAKDCLHIVLPGGDHGFSGGPVYLSNYSKILGLVWMGSRYEGTQTNLLCSPAAWIKELPLTEPNDWQVPNNFPRQGNTPTLSSAQPVKSTAVGITSFVVLPIPTGANINCYLDDDYLISKFNQQTLGRVLPRGRSWWDVTHPATGFAMAVPDDYKLTEQTQQIQFYNENNPQPVLTLTAKGDKGDTVTTHIYSRQKGVPGNAYDQLVGEIVRYRRSVLGLRLVGAPNNDNGFQPSADDKYCQFGPNSQIDPREYSVGSNDVRMWRLYIHRDNQGQFTGKATLSVIGIRGDNVVATTTEFDYEDWTRNAPLEFATRFFILGTYSFLD
jgi:hypothetical protein